MFETPLEVDAEVQVEHISSTPRVESVLKSLCFESLKVQCFQAVGFKFLLAPLLGGVCRGQGGPQARGLDHEEEDQPPTSTGGAVQADCIFIVYLCVPIICKLTVYVYPCVL